MSSRVFTTSIITIVLLTVGYIVWTLDHSPQDMTSSHSSASGVAESDIVKSPILQNKHNSSKKFIHLTDTTKRWQVKVDHLRRLNTRDLSQKDINELYNLLNYNEYSNDPEHWYVVINEIMEQIVRQGIDKTRITDTLISIIADPSRDEVIRDYAVQHLANWIAPQSQEAITSSSHEQNPEKIDAALISIQDAIQSPANHQTSITGTAIMAFAYLQQRSAHVDKIETIITQLEPQLTQIISEESDANLVTQTSVISALGILNRTEHLPAIREIIINQNNQLDKTTESLKLTSIAALGHLAEEQDISTLNSIANSDSKFKYAARSALEKIAQR